ncbi:hypothetical protein OG978_44405 (plasmid) [Streptomyces sp. NBC_01591]|uniref:hypothetical protein n=1 Tax=Streptomyces sp. NBC_01591 TaxID=2975888 RepID=UPI002DD98782|nr:hypothetical protein [Streptomyces sp. NBC_01591]WSD74163.1 hypothetical protein OG978_44405 [Streptomyces sp. NBC_01591]
MSTSIVGRIVLGAVAALLVHHVPLPSTAQSPSASRLRRGNWLYIPLDIRLPFTDSVLIVTVDSAIASFMP